MTRKDYVLIAAAIKQTRDMYRIKRDVHSLESLDRTSLALNAVQQVADEVATALRLDNPRFNRERFMRACGFED